ncbi:MAG: DUF4831 family protein [Tannerella sp.]|jgi:hypothetical protein|nr:DUF4831 family protein [Tannerella sp.]
MRYLFAAACLLWGFASLSAQTNVIKKIAAKSNDYGVDYTLPKTSILVRAEVIKHTVKAGPYARYADKYLGVSNPIQTDRSWYELGALSLTNPGVPDHEQTYRVEFKPGTTAPYVYLTQEGFLCSINAPYSPAGGGEADSTAVAAPPKAPVAMQAMTEEMLMAGSVAKQAEVAAKQIYRIRESRMNILTGEADNPPADGVAMKLVIAQLEQQEKALTRLFTGTSTSQSSYYDFSLVPEGNVDKEVLFRFSERLGIVDADDLAGAPVYLNLHALLPPEQEAPGKDKKDKQSKGLVYNVPAKAEAEILKGGKSLLKQDVMVVQFGDKETLANALFADKKKPVKIYFYPQTGAIRQIIQ